MTEISDCLNRADKLAANILGSPKPITDTVFLELCGSLPRKTLDERLEEMSEDQRHALELIKEIGKEYEGLFADFTPQERKKTRPEVPPPSEPKLPRPPRPKVSKKCFEEAKNVGICINNLIGLKRDDIAIKTASALCLCGEKLTKRG